VLVGYPVTRSPTALLPIQPPCHRRPCLFGSPLRLRMGRQHLLRAAIIGNNALRHYSNGRQVNKQYLVQLEHLLSPKILQDAAAAARKEEIQAGVKSGSRKSPLSTQSLGCQCQRRREGSERLAMQLTGWPKLKYIQAARRRFNYLNLILSSAQRGAKVARATWRMSDVCNSSVGGTTHAGATMFTFSLCQRINTVSVNRN